MMMLPWMCGVTRKYKIRNEHIRGTTRVAQASKKITERRLIWYRHVMRRDGEHILRKVLRADIPTREKEERTTETKMERRVSTRFEKYWTENGRGDGQGDVEKKDHQSYRRLYMMGKARGKVMLRSNHLVQTVRTTFPVVQTVPFTFPLGISHLHLWRSGDGFSDSVCTAGKKMASLNRKPSIIALQLQLCNALVLEDYPCAGSMFFFNRSTLQCDDILTNQLAANTHVIARETQIFQCAAIN